MRIKHVIVKEGMDYLDIREEFLKSDAEALFLQAEYVTLPEDAIKKLAVQMYGGIHCISGWTPMTNEEEEPAWNTLKLVSNNTVCMVKRKESGITRADFITLECVMFSRELMEKVTFDGRPLYEFRWITGFKFHSSIEHNLCNSIYENGYEIYMHGDVVCEKQFLPEKPDIVDPPVVKGSDKVIVVFCADDRYAMPVGIAIRSLLDHFPKDRELEIIVGSNGISDENRAKIRGVYPVQFVDLDMSKVDDIPINIIYHTETIFGRLILLDNLDYDKVLYMDCDIVVMKDITKLWDMDVSNHTLAAAQDSSIQERDGYVYFNSGVLLINMRLWKKKKMSKKAIKFVQKKITNFTDQDALNDALKGDYLRIGRRWNRNTPKPYEDEVNILHFIGGEKPWWFGSTLEIVPEYFRLIDRTPFAGWRPKSPIEQREAEIEVI